MKESTKIWQVKSNDWYLRDIAGTTDKLQNTIYVLEANPDTGELYLKNTGTNFKFDFKIYGLKGGLVKRIVKYYKNSKSNLGVLLNGIKGTGKTITAKILANELNLPIILIGKKYNGIVSFLSQIDTDVIVMIDEYDKIFIDKMTTYDAKNDIESNHEDATLLSLMDGVFSNSYRRTFILTTNELWLNENMLNRPGRIRYKETFADLELVTINEIIDDLLVNKEYKDEIIEYIKSLKIITVDIIKAIISEINIFNESPTICCASMNLEFLDHTYSAYEVIDKSEALIEKNISLKTFESFAKFPKINNIYLCGQHYRLDKGGKYKEGESLDLVNIYDKEDKKKVLFIKEEPIHRSFVPSKLMELVA